MSIIYNQHFKNYLVRGDCHGNFDWMTNGSLNNYIPNETAIIVLGDAGFNFYLNNTEARHNKEINNRGYTFYVVRGNHEARPQDIKDMDMIYDENVNGVIYFNPEIPNIRYFMDYSDYYINGYKIFVIGGAYSVDKWYRLSRLNMTPETNIPTKSGWFNNEQLTQEEMEKAEWEMFRLNDDFDFIFSHTCPLRFEPTDLFLNFVDQSTVDQSMEKWMDRVYNRICRKGKPIWCFGHFHRDRIEAPRVEMYYNDLEDLNTVYERWKKYDETGELDWYLTKSPFFEEHAQLCSE